MAEVDGVREELGALYPLVRYVIPPVLAAVTAAKAAGVARPAWRLLVGWGRTDGIAVAAVLFLGVASAGLLLWRRRAAR